MTTDKIRKKVNVISWDTNQDGVFINYEFKQNSGKLFSKSIKLSPIEACEELKNIGSIVGFKVGNIPEVIWNTGYYSWKEFSEKFDLCQWEALNIVIRHEFAISMDKALEKTDIGKAINKLKKI